MQTTYVIRFWNKGQTEEYDGGKTLADARKEAAFFREHISADTEIRICKLKKDNGAYGMIPYLVEVV